jgi:hypothetical protein
VTVLFSEVLLEFLETLPDSVKLGAPCSVALLSVYRSMYPVRQRCLMRGHRYFMAGRFLFYYSVATEEIRIAAIIPATMGLA